ncbi:hypothetical protein J2782_004146 [Brucella pseudogrignonensis]|uniref:Uncharacterized protein n=1 Tax=Brucella pseudogrignonensis TaxID=419475 RepID=A0ABU1MEB4_9HYPH|nr:hypothetical protein [Brucella pseudogrignonensis]
MSCLDTPGTLAQGSYDITISRGIFVGGSFVFEPKSRIRPCRKSAVRFPDFQSIFPAPTQSRRTTLPNALKAELQKILLRHAIMEGMMCNWGSFSMLLTLPDLPFPCVLGMVGRSSYTNGKWVENTSARSAQRDNLWWNHQLATSEGLDVYASEPDLQSAARNEQSNDSMLHGQRPPNARPDLLKITIRNGIRNIEEHCIKDDTFGEMKTFEINRHSQSPHSIIPTETTIAQQK